MYVPIFEPSEVQCEIHTFIETRSRASANQLYFRSKTCGNYNSLRIKSRLNGTTVFGSVIREEYRIEYFENDIWHGPSVIYQDVDLQNQTTVVSGVPNLRLLIQSSELIDMPNPGVDTNSPNTSNASLSEFDVTLSGGQSGPSNGDDILNIRTGPLFTLICITSTENENGSPITPVNKIRFWDGVFWQVFGD